MFELVVVGGTLLFIGERFVCLVDFFELFSRRIAGEVGQVREGKDDNGTDNTMEILAKIPR